MLPVQLHVALMQELDPLRSTVHLPRRRYLDQTLYSVLIQTPLPYQKVRHRHSYHGHSRSAMVCGFLLRNYVPGFTAGIQLEPWRRNCDQRIRNVYRFRRH